MLVSIIPFVFVIGIIISTFLQASDNPLKKIGTPALTAGCGLIVLYAAISGSVPFVTGLVLAVALFLLASSDFTFEQSLSDAKLFPLAMVLGVVSGFSIGILFNMLAFKAGIPLLVQIGFFVIGIIAAMLVYRQLEVGSEFKLAISIYLVQAVILLAGGLASWYVGNYEFAVWGIFLFVSDSLVGIRAFPSSQKPKPWLNSYRILFAIIVIYYAAQYALVAWAV